MNPKTPITPPFEFRILVSPGEDASSERQSEEAQRWLSEQRDKLFAEWSAANPGNTLDVEATDQKKWDLLFAAFPTAESRRIMFTVF